MESKILCGHCGVPLMKEPKVHTGYSHEQEGQCPFRGVAMPCEAWLAIEEVYSRVASGPGKDHYLLTQNISALDLSTRTQNALLAAKIDTVGKLVAMPPYHLFKQKGVGETGLEECARALERRGLMLGDRRYLSLWVAGRINDSG